MKRKNKVQIAILLSAIIITILTYTRPMKLSQICDHIDITKMEAINITYEVQPDNEITQYIIKDDDPRFTLLMNLITKQNYQRSLWSLLPQGPKTHNIQSGDYKWELGCIFTDNPMKDGSTISGTVIHISNFYGDLEIWYAGKNWQCSTKNQPQWTSAIMESILIK